MAEGQVNMLQIFQVGDVIENYCNGYFGRDDYERKVCVMVTPKYAVFQYEDGQAAVLNYSEGLEKYAKGENWKAYDEEY